MEYFIPPVCLGRDANEYSGTNPVQVREVKPCFREVIALQQKLVPELIEVTERRYNILRNASILQPVGRRGLAQQTGLSERLVRNEVDFLRERGLLETEAGGVRVTVGGEHILNGLQQYIRDLKGLTHMEEELARRLRLEQVVVIPGDADTDPMVKMELGRAAARLLREKLRRNDIVAVTGGTTLYELANALQGRGFQDVTVVPARGGLGEDVEMQANTIAARMAQKIGASYRMLHVPENLGDEALAALAQDPKITEIISLIKSADILVHGIGKAEEMAGCREADPAEIARIKDEGAVGETFGYYFDRAGHIVHATPSLGIRLDDLSRIGHIIAVAGGRGKAEAVVSVLRNESVDILITDEGAAGKMISFLDNK